MVNFSFFNISVLLRTQRRHIEQVKVVLHVILDYLYVASSGAYEEDKDSLNDLLSAAIIIGSSIQEICQKLEGQSKEVLCAILGLYVLQNIALILGSRQRSVVETSSLIVAKFSQFLPFCGLSYFGLLTGLSKIQEARFRRWQAIGMFKHTLSSIDYPWNIKSHGIDLLLSMFDGIIYEEDDSGVDFSSFLPNLFSSLMAIERIMMGAPDPLLRKRAFIALRVCLGQLWGFKALEIVEMVLRPPKGGPPSLPEDSEPVLSALNLYGFIIIIELTGKTNYTGVLSEDSLRKAYSEWIMPLRTLVSGILAENENDGGKLDESITCALSPVQLVLHRCIELIEESLKQTWQNSIFHCISSNFQVQFKILLLFCC
ncbi:Aberrant root formation protein 4 [Platanthera zijinensis]|uniref:Aberrant root formation protein 4 n=1 Tax=Platanthera zijinensis TaxID=2320716 RepID=A0AAP0G5R3_9ASPA